MTRHRCPTCGRTVGQNGTGLAKHFPGNDPASWGVRSCAGTGMRVVAWTVVDEPESSAAPVPVPPPAPWLPPPQPVDLAPFRRWRSYGWTERQIAAVTGEGALW